MTNGTQGFHWQWRALHPRRDSADILRISLEAYTREAALIGASDFPPLAETIADISGSKHFFYAAMDDSSMGAVIEAEPREDSWDINRLVVADGYQRRGAGRFLVNRLLEECGEANWTVSTAMDNKPALALYESAGFRQTRQWRNVQGYELVELERVSR